MFRQIVEAAHEGILVVDPDGRIAFANARAGEILGVRADDLLGRPIGAFVVAEVRGAVAPRFTPRDGEGHARFDVRLQRHDHAIVWTIVSTSPLVDDAGVLVGRVAMITDVTARHRAEEALRRAHDDLERQIDERTRFLESLLENLPDMVFVKDADDLRFVRLNRAGEELLGYARDELIGKSDFDLFPAAEAEHFVAADRAVLRSGRVVEIPEEPVHTRGRGVRILRTKKIPVLDAEGRPRFLLGVSEDVTDRRQADRERRRREQAEAARARAERLAEAGSALAATTDERGALRVLADHLARGADRVVIVVRRRDAEARVVVVTASDPRRAAALSTLVGRTILPEGDGLPRVLRERRRVVVRGTDRLADAEGVRDLLGLTDAPRIADGPRTLLAVPLSTSGEILVAVAIVAPTDLDDDQLALDLQLVDRGSLALHDALLREETRRAVELREGFLSVAAHELRTPLTALQLQLGLVLRLARSHALATLSDAKLTALATSTEGAMRRLELLVERLLDLSRLGAGKLTLALEEVDLAALVRDAASRVDADSSGSVVSIEARAPVVGRWDRARLEQVVVNLLTNAVKFGLGRPIEVRVGPGPAGARIVVRDHGIGIAVEDQTRLFGRFERAVSERHFGGLGLGLYVTRELVAAHGGTVDVVSAPGEGATFTVDLPLTPPAGGQVTA